MSKCCRRSNFEDTYKGENGWGVLVSLLVYFLRKFQNFAFLICDTGIYLRIPRIYLIQKLYVIIR